MIKVATALALILTILLLPHSAAAADTTATTAATTVTGNGEIDGTIVNGTAGGTVPSALTVHLSIYQNQNAVDVRTTQSSADGNFTFTQMPTDSSYSFAAGAVYKNVQYVTDLFSFGSGQTKQTTELKIYETTTDAVSFSESQSHTVVDYSDNSLNVSEYHFFNSTGDRTYIGKTVDAASGRLETVSLSLPAGAANVQVDSALPNDLTVNGSTLSWAGPIIPGTTNPVVYSYSIPANSDSYTFDWKINYDIGRLDFVVLNQKIHISGPKLIQQQSLDISGNTYQDYSSENLKAGDNLAVQLTGLSGDSRSSILWFLLLIPVIGAAVFLILWRKKKASKPAPVHEEISDEADALMREIAVLDNRFEDGSIDEEEYRTLRAEKKQKLFGLKSKTDES